MKEKILTLFILSLVVLSGTAAISSMSSANALGFGWSVYFSETGLPAGITWAITVNGVQYSANSGSEITLGPYTSQTTFNFALSPLLGYKPIPQSGSFSASSTYTEKISFTGANNITWNNWITNATTSTHYLGFGGSTFYYGHTIFLISGSNLYDVNASTYSVLTSYNLGTTGFSFVGASGTTLYVSRQNGAYAGSTLENFTIPNLVLSGSWNLTGNAVLGLAENPMYEFSGYDFPYIYAPISNDLKSPVFTLLWNATTSEGVGFNVTAEITGFHFYNLLTHHLTNISLPSNITSISAQSLSAFPTSHSTSISYTQVEAFSPYQFGLKFAYSSITGSQSNPNQTFSQTPKLNNVTQVVSSYIVTLNASSGKAVQTQIPTLPFNPDGINFPVQGSGNPMDTPGFMGNYTYNWAASPPAMTAYDEAYQYADNGMLYFWSPTPYHAAGISSLTLGSSSPTIMPVIVPSETLTLYYPGELYFMNSQGYAFRNLNLTRWVASTISGMASNGNTIYLSSNITNTIYTINLPATVPLRVISEGLSAAELQKGSISLNGISTVAINSTNMTSEVFPSIYTMNIQSPNGYVLQSVRTEGQISLLNKTGVFNSASAQVLLNVTGDPSVILTFGHPQYNISFIANGFILGSRMTINVTHGSNPTAAIYHGNSLPLQDANATNYTLSYASSSDVASFYLLNGTYNYTASVTEGIITSGMQGSFSVAGKPLNITLTVIGGSKLIFSESGLPKGTTWSVGIGSNVEVSNSSVIVFYVMNGTYNYLIYSPSGYSASPSSGSVTVTGPDTVMISFTAQATGGSFTTSDLFTEVRTFIGDNWIAVLLLTIISILAGWMLDVFANPYNRKKSRSKRGRKNGK